MATQEIVEVTDDIDGYVITGLGETIEFAVDGVEYYLDLKPKHASEFRSMIEHWTTHAVRVGGRKRKPANGIGAPAATASTPAAPAVSAKRDPEQTRAIRQWAADSGYEISDRGRIPASIEQAYTAAH